jgi:hypothetical protein
MTNTKWQSTSIILDLLFIIKVGMTIKHIVFCDSVNSNLVSVVVNLVMLLKVIRMFNFSLKFNLYEQNYYLIFFF